MTTPDTTPDRVCPARPSKGRAWGTYIMGTPKKPDKGKSPIRLHPNGQWMTEVRGRNY